MRTSRALTQALKASVMELRSLLRECETMSFMRLYIECEGRVNDGEVKITMQLGDYNESCKGAELTDVAEEFMRRHGWNKRHAPLMISHDGDERLESERVVSHKRKLALRKLADVRRDDDYTDE